MTFVQEIHVRLQRLAVPHRAVGKLYKRNAPEGIPRGRGAARLGAARSLLDRRGWQEPRMTRQRPSVSRDVG